LQQLALTAHGTQTGRLEVLHSFMLTYVTKRIDYNPPSYWARTTLVICDYNENWDRNGGQRKTAKRKYNINNIKLFVAGVKMDHLL
jgi:hypothetical protein